MRLLVKSIWKFHKKHCRRFELFGFLGGYYQSTKNCQVNCMVMYSITNNANAGQPKIKKYIKY